MTYFPKPTLAVHQRLNESAMVDMGTVITIPTTRGPGGVDVEGAPVRGLKYPCRMTIVSEASESLQADALAVEAEWIVVMPVYANVVRGQRVEVSERDGKWQRTVEVKGIGAPRSINTQRFLLCHEVK